MNIRTKSANENMALSIIHLSIRLPDCLFSLSLVRRRLAWQLAAAIPKRAPPSDLELWASRRRDGYENGKLPTNTVEKITIALDR